MATVSVRLRNEGNTTGTTALDAYDIQFQVERNALGTARFKMTNPPATAVPDGSVVQFTVAGTARFAARVVAHEVDDVSVSDESVEATTYICRGLAVDMAEAWLAPKPGVADLVPSMDQRHWNWASPDYEVDGDWETPVELALQGWASDFYRGQPAGWSDPAAAFLWSSDGDTDDAPAGFCYFRETITVAAGKKYLEWGCDNYGIVYVNGKEMGRGEDFRRKFELEFETTAGELTLAWRIQNAADDGPPGGNPGAMIASMRAGGPEGTVEWRSSDSMDLLAYPTGGTPEIPVGKIIRDMWIDSALYTDWTLIGTDLLDTGADAWDTMVSFTARIYEDSVLDVFDQLGEEYLDWVFLPSGKEVRPYIKGNLSTAVTFDLVTGYSTAGIATPAGVNVLDLSWDVRRAECDQIAVRWADGWTVRGSGDRQKAVRAEQLISEGAGDLYGDSLLVLYGSTQATATFEYVPLNEATDLPFVAFDVHDAFPIPGPYDHDTTQNQDVWAITVTGGARGDTAASDEGGGIAVEVGDPLRGRIERVERAAKRGVASLAGLSTAAFGRGQPIRAQLATKSTPAATEMTVRLVSDPFPATRSVVFSCPFVGRVVNLRMEGTSDGGTSTYEVSVGATTYTLSGSGSGLLDSEAVGVSWDTTTQITVECTAVGHVDVAILADITRVNS